MVFSWWDGVLDCLIGRCLLAFPQKKIKLTRQKNKGAETVSASTPRCSAAPAASAPVADLVVMVQGADAVTVARRGLDGGDAQRGQSEGGRDQLVRGRSFEMRISNAGVIRPACVNAE